MKCAYCGSYDSMIDYYFVDRNHDVFSRSELNAFGILHPEAQGLIFQQVLLCGQCAVQLIDRPAGRLLCY